MTKLINDLLDLKQWVRKTGAKREGKGQFSNIHSEKQILDLINEYNIKNKKKINVLWFNTGVEFLGDNKVMSSAKVIVSNGEEHMEMISQGIGEEKRGDIAFALGKAMTYSKRFFLSKLVGLSSDDLDPEHVSNAPTAKATKSYVKTTTKKVVKETPKDDGLAYYKSGTPVKTKDGVHLTQEQNIKASSVAKLNDKRIWDLDFKEIA